MKFRHQYHWPSLSCKNAGTVHRLIPVLLCQLGTVILLAQNAASADENSRFGDYFVALLWYLTLSALYFGRLILRRRQGDEDLKG